MLEKIPSERHVGIDALRLVSMLMVCLFHVQIMTGNTPYVAVACCIAVNLFAIISGYVCIQSHWKIKRYINLWMQVAFYCVLCYALWYIMSCIGLIKNYQPSVYIYFLPVPLAGFNWYFTAYTGLFLVMPFINKLASVLNKQQYLAMIILSVFCLSVLTTLRQTHELFYNGFNTAWLIALYLVGGYFKMHHVNISWKLCVTVYTTCVIGMAAMHNIRGFTPFDYASPLSLISACVVFQLFAKWRPTRPCVVKSIEFFVPYAFGVYLIHVQPPVWHYIQKAVGLVNYRVCSEWWMIVLPALVIFVACLLIDMCRGYLFHWLKVGVLAEKISASCPAWLRELEKM